MKVKKDKKEKKSLKEMFKERFSGMTFKSYLKETMLFIKNNMLKCTLIILGITLLSFASVIYSPESFQLEKTNITFFSDWFERIQVLAIIVAAGVVPYMFVPVFGLLAGLSTECMYFANYIGVVGRMKGSLVYIAPYIFNMLLLSAATAIGIYICINATISQRILSIKSKNSMDLKMSIYEAMNKKDKKNAIEKQRKEKINKLEAKKQKIDLFQIVNLIVILSVVQLAASLVKSLII